MSTKSKEKTRARRLQEATRLSYSTCLRIVRSMTPGEVEASLTVIMEKTPIDYSALIEIANETARDRR